MQKSKLLKLIVDTNLWVSFELKKFGKIKIKTIVGFIDKTKNHR